MEVHESGDDRRCPLCRDLSGVELLLKKGGFEILLCRRCELRYSSPSENPGNGWYESSSIYEHRARGPRLLNPSRDWRFTTTLKIMKEKGGERVLDIGCGDGGFLSLASARGYDVCGVDIDRRAVEIARDHRGLERVYEGSWEECGRLGLGEFDWVTMLDFFEHFGKPLPLLEGVMKLVRSEGSVLMTVPRLDRFPRIFDPDLDFPPHHFTIWSRRSLLVMADKGGLREVEIIEKPLNGEDLFISPLLAFKRTAGKMKGPVQKRGSGDGGEGHSVIPSTDRKAISPIGLRAKGVLRQSILAPFHLTAFLMRRSARVKGFTLLFHARKG